MALWALWRNRGKIMFRSSELRTFYKLHHRGALGWLIMTPPQFRGVTLAALFYWLGKFLQEGLVIRPITFRLIGLIKVIPAPISSDWSYKSQIRKNDLLQILCFELVKKNRKFFFCKYTHNPNFRVIGLIAVIPAHFFSSDWSYSHTWFRSYSHTCFRSYNHPL